MRLLHRGACAIVVGVLGTACQWVLPLHEEDPRGETASTDGGAGGTDALPNEDATPEDAPLPDATNATDAGGDAERAPTCTGKYTYVPACDDCLNARCCAESAACFVTNPECTALLACMASCGFDFITCPKNCTAAHASGAFDAQRASACTEGYCKRECSRDGGA